MNGIETVSISVVEALQNLQVCLEQNVTFVMGKQLMQRYVQNVNQLHANNVLIKCLLKIIYVVIVNRLY